MSAAPVKTLKINGKDVAAAEHETVLDAARSAGVSIPTLCELDGLTSVGACRMCLVEVKGTAKLLPACVTRVEEGMEVTTDSERLSKYRQMILELLFSERNHVCSVCVSNGRCELQSQAQTQGVTHLRVPYLFPQHPVDASHKLFTLDHNRCILCTRCVRVCDEIEGAHTWDVMGRGAEARVISDLAQPWGESDSCTSCGKCVNVCPTGALSEKGQAVAESNKHRQWLPQLAWRRGKET